MPTINFLWNPVNDNIVKEFDENGNTLVDYTTEPDLYGNVVSQNRSGQSSYFHSDVLGSTIAVTDASGNVTDTQAYTAFGETAERSGGTETPVQFVGAKGYYTDAETESIEVRERPFTPRQSRWLSVDAAMRFLSWLAIARDQVTAYVYCSASPVNYVDPSGLQWTGPDIEIPEIPVPELPPTEPLPPQSPVPGPCDLTIVPCSVRKWEPWMCNYTDAFGHTTHCKCSDTLFGQTASDAQCEQLLLQARRMVELRLGENVVIGRFYCDDQCGGTDYGLTCWRRLRGGRNRNKIEIGVCIPSASKTHCDLFPLILHEITHVLDLMELLDEEGPRAEPNRIPFEAAAYQAQCALYAAQRCIPLDERRAWVADCVRRLNPLSTDPTNINTIERGCDAFRW
jgi:RHS repeat-associated protein